VSPTAHVIEPDCELGGTRSIYSALVETAATDPDREFLRDGARALTYAELRNHANDLAGRLAGLGIGAGDRVVLWLPNGEDWATTFFACARIGAIVVTAGTRLRALDIRHIGGDSGAVALVFAPRFLGLDFDAMVDTALSGGGDGGLLVRHVLATAPSIARGARTLADLPAAAPPAVFTDARAPAVVCYTSGTTGRPKGCVHSHATLIRNGTVAAALTDLRAGDRIVCPVPFAHVFGFHMGVLQATLSAATLLNAEPYDPEALLDVAAAERATVLYLVPTMAREVLAAQRQRPRDLSTLRLALVAGAPVSPGLRTALRASDGLGCDVSVTYGCTEAPTLTQLVPGDAPPASLSSVGRATDGVEVRTVAEGTARALEPGEVGEIVTRGYNHMLGYLGDDDATAAALRDGWLVTGDLGWIDEDGFVYVVGRASEMFLVGGFNAYPREIEAQIEQLAGVVEAAVLGVPDARLGWVPMAWVTVSSVALGEAEILSWAREQLATYKRPRYVRVVESLPRTATGKLSRVKLEQLARRALPHLAWEGRDR
jgi:acyl-CoA synthetase (AMP-forming)/AMP-acid ligase II